MSNIDTWSPWVAIAFLGGPMLLAAWTLAYSLYLTHRHLDAIKEALKNSRYIYIWGPSLGKRGLIWSLLEMSKITGMIMWPKASLILGELDPVDLKNFPPYLKRRLTVNLKIMIIAFIWMLIGVALLKLR
ncbi:hypothetical protein YA0871_10795 [Pseudomonas paralactis]|uniref:Uncharacterized protein n=1 Tax=Pseudomonas paralactis TaxID=1615673 RepID=A0A0R3A8K9_9PSED|nr:MULTISPECIES: hypothetical protein [Pseudomonas]KRP69728.1 hypothetical protein TX23_22850 [Pseudomonas paralactis]MBC3257767.1 hypothetical protein [Pseudomonas paralactis]MBI6633153.1 hypothetical protein [Pseudomonas paralactis]MBJ2220581.1 hypothetical protein [Pseudomonas sp. MF7453]